MMLEDAGNGNEDADNEDRENSNTNQLRPRVFFFLIGEELAQGQNI